jgi:hypothetical protein
MYGKEIKKDFDFLKKHTLQPAWWKITKVFILFSAILTIWKIFGVLKTAIWSSIIVLMALVVHIIYRIKTHTYKKSWMDFKVKEIDSKLIYERIGLLYYSLVVFIFLIATITIILLR